MSSLVVRFAALFAAVASGVQAHMSVNPREVPDEGSYFRVAVRVPHGCGVGEGDDRVYYPTHTVEVNVPAEIAQESTARGEWIPFWPLAVEDQDDGSRKFTWKAESEDYYLGEDQFKEFGITMKVPAMGSETAPEDGSFEFPSYQYCTEGEVAPWDGEDSPQLTYETVALMEEDGHSDSSTTTTPEAPTAGAHAGHSSGVAGAHGGMYSEDDGVYGEP